MFQTVYGKLLFKKHNDTRYKFLKYLLSFKTILINDNKEMFWKKGFTVCLSFSFQKKKIIK